MKTQLLAAPLVLLALILLGGCAPQKAQSFSELVKNGTPQAVKAAIEKGAYVNASDWQDITVLMYAAGNNPNPEVITTLLKAGADIKAHDSVYGKTALMWAAQFNKNPEVTAVLLKAGADIEARSGSNQPWTALMWAAQSTTNPDVITTLLKAGADIKEPDKDGLTPLMIAAENTNPEVITRLISSGADLEAKDQNGFTALMGAASKNHNPDVIIALLKAGANAKAKNNKGYTALDYAKANRNLDGTDALKALQATGK